MNLERVTFISSLALVGAFILKEVLNSDIKARTMAVRRRRLQELLDDQSFEALSFGPSYNERTLVRDRLGLVAYRRMSNSTSPNLTPEKIDVANRERIFAKDRNYAAYRLGRESIEQILNHFSGEEVEFILLEPVFYEDDPRYLAYKLIPADAMKNPVPVLPEVNIQTQPVRAAMPENAMNEGGIQTRSYALTSTRTRELIVNPSPPATNELM